MTVRTGESYPRDKLLRALVDIQYRRNDMVLGPRPLPRARRRRRGAAGVLGDGLPRLAVRRRGRVDHALRPAQRRGLRARGRDHDLPGDALRDDAADDRARRRRRSARSSSGTSREFEEQGKLLEAHRLRQRTEYDLEMMQELGYCNGIENYSRVLDGRAPGQPPFTLLDYFPGDFLVMIDESHQTVPQIGGMYEGDRSRKEALVAHGFRLPLAMDNRPLRFDEFLERVPQAIFVSATPGPYEMRVSSQVVEQIIRPTGLVDPEVEVRPTRHQIDDLLAEIRLREEAGERVLVHDADEEDGRGPDRLPDRVGRPRALPALRDRHARAHPDHPPAAPRRVRRARRRQPAARGPRPARGLARRDPGCRQGRLPARADGADPDDRPRRAPRQRPRGDVRRQAHAGDRGGDRRDRAPPRDPARLQRGARHHAGLDRQGRVRHLRAALARRRAARPEPRAAPRARSRA